MDFLVRKLKNLYAKDAEHLAFTAYKDFETFQRPLEMTIVEYINEFE